MPRTSYLFTSESVSEGHPDKVCDRISDAIVDAYLTADPYSRVAVETMATTNRVFLAGETRGPASVTNDLIEQVVRRAIKEIGYEQDGFHWQKVKIETFIHPQSADIAQGVDAKGNKDEGAGDQGIMRPRSNSTGFTKAASAGAASCWDWTAPTSSFAPTTGISVFRFAPSSTRNSCSPTSSSRKI